MSGKRERTKPGELPGGTVFHQFHQGKIAKLNNRKTGLKGCERVETPRRGADRFDKKQNRGNVVTKGPRNGEKKTAQSCAGDPITRKGAGNQQIEGGRILTSATSKSLKPELPIEENFKP